jgi:16S rRNA (uracil1498-N3)-methyltransferase
MQIFYAPNITGSSYTLPEDEARHCLRVLRMREGDEVKLVDGKGNIFTGRISSPNPKECILEIIEKKSNYGKRPFYLHIAIAPTKNADRFEWFAEKATEIGVDEITPLLCERSERKSVNSERIERVVISAMKQSEKAYLPTLNAMTSLEKLMANTPADFVKLIAHCNEKSIPHLKKMVKPGEKVLILIGPEGDFSPREVDLALENGFRAISLGSSRLRTETAGMVACHAVNMLNTKDFS